MHWSSLKFCFSFVFITIYYLVSNKTKTTWYWQYISAIGISHCKTPITRPPIYSIYMYILYLLQRNLSFTLNTKHEHWCFSHVPDLSTADQWSWVLQHWWSQQYLLRPPRTSAPVWSGLVGWSAWGDWTTPGHIPQRSDEQDIGWRLILLNRWDVQCELLQLLKLQITHLSFKDISNWTILNIKTISNYHYQNPTVHWFCTK